MSYMTTELITGAYYASGIVSREFETVSGGQIADGLQFLNDILAEKAIDSGMIPYETTYNMNLVTGQTVYTIPNLVEISTITFFLDGVRYSMAYSGRNNYFGSPRVDGITTLPYQWYFERGLGGGKLYIYFGPDRNYPLEIHGLFRLDNVVLGQDLSLSIDQFYLTYLRYCLTDRLCAEYEYVTPVNVIRQLSKYESWINKKSRVLDMRMRKVSTLGSQNYGGWAQINLGKGFTPV